jgi:hypothetical protein
VPLFELLHGPDVDIGVAFGLLLCRISYGHVVH